MDDYELENNLTLIGLIGIEDPLRPEIAKSVEIAKNAGITVRMVTGDNLVTACAISK